VEDESGWYPLKAFGISGVGPLGSVTRSRVVLVPTYLNRIRGTNVEIIRCYYLRKFSGV